MEWTQLKVSCRKADLETVCAVMSMLDNGLMIDDRSDIAENVRPEFGEVIGEELLSGTDECSVSIFIPENKDAAGYLDFLRARLDSESVIYSYSFSDCSEEQWSDSWKKYYKRVKLGKKLVIVPEWEEYKAKEGEVCVRMDPGMAFGTGTHETTRLCARLLEKYMKPGDLVLDIGTGSGILGIAASKLGASYVECLDIDPVAVSVALDNVRANGVDNVDCRVSDLCANVDDSRGDFDFVCANIVADVLLRLVPEVGGYMKTDSLIACSGIIGSQYEEVREAFVQRGFSVVKRLSENDWNAVLFKKL